MNFTVLWSINAESRLTRLWLESSHRQSITDAANKIEAQLRRDAPNVGESRTGNRRVVHESPLGIVFTVQESDRTVAVLDVWRYERRDR